MDVARTRRHPASRLAGHGRLHRRFPHHRRRSAPRRLLARSSARPPAPAADHRSHGRRRHPHRIRKTGARMACSPIRPTASDSRSGDRLPGPGRVHSFHDRLVLLYRIGRPGHPGFRSLFPGAIVSTVLWWVVDVLFGVYVRKMPYDVVYGGLAAAIGLLLWMYLTAVVV